MAFTFVAFAYIVGLILTALLIFLAIWHVGNFRRKIEENLFFVLVLK